MEKESLTKTMEENKSLQIQSNTMDTNDEKKKKNCAKRNVETS
jgi:hypothetical protein